jgi:hypothetical protein
VCFSAAVPALAQAAVGDAKPVFLVTDVVVGDGVDIDREVARDVLATRFGRLKDKLEVRSMAEAKASLNAAALAQLLGSGDDSQLSKVEEYVKVDRIVFGRISKVAGIVDVQVKVFNVREGVTEVGFARRLKAGASPTMVLTLLDSLSDSLLAWTINTYTDAAPSAAATRLAGKKLGGKKAEPDVVASSSSPWSAVGAIGGLGLGLGVGAGGVGVYNALVDNDASGTDIAIIGAGAVVAVIGTVAVVADVLTE